jgi:hypothetical protein
VSQAAMAWLHGTHLIVRHDYRMLLLALQDRGRLF